MNDKRYPDRETTWTVIVAVVFVVVVAIAYSIGKVHA